MKTKTPKPQAGKPREVVSEWVVRSERELYWLVSKDKGGPYGSVLTVRNVMELGLDTLGLKHGQRVRLHVRVEVVDG